MTIREDAARVLRETQTGRAGEEGMVCVGKMRVLVEDELS